MIRLDADRHLLSQMEAKYNKSTHWNDLLFVVHRKDNLISEKCVS